MDVLGVMQLDAVPSSHPVSLSANSPDEINSIFDDIAYFKGSSLIRMINYFLSSSTFKKGITVKRI